MLALSTVLLVWPAPQASAQTVSECQAQIDALRVQTQNATFIGQNAEKDRVGLLGKLESASVKLSQGKFADAIQALTNFRDKASTLGEQGRCL